MTNCWFPKQINNIVVYTVMVDDNQGLIFDDNSIWWKAETVSGHKYHMGIQNHKYARLLNIINFYIQDATFSC